MFAIREGVIKVHDVMLPTYSRNVHAGGESFVVEAGVSSSFEDKSCHDCELSFLRLFCPTHGIYSSQIRDRNGLFAGFELTVYGKDALDGLITSLEFALTALRDARGGVRD